MVLTNLPVRFHLHHLIVIRDTMMQVEKVRYPGLKSSPQHALVQEQFWGSGGGVLSFELKGGKPAAEALLRVSKQYIPSGMLDAHPLSSLLGVH